MNENYQANLQDKVVDEFPTILSLLDEYYETDSVPLVDEKFDVEVDDSFEYLRVLQGVLDLGESTEAIETMYRSFHFAVSVAGLANWQYDVRGLFYKRYCHMLADKHGDDKELLTRRIITDAQAYMVRNPTLASVVTTYESRLASSSACRELAYTVTALTLMQIDEDIAERASRHSDALRVIDETNEWDGDITKWGEL